MKSENAPICAAMAKDALRKREMKKLNKIFKTMPKSQRDVVEGLKQQAVFMYSTLDELQQIINTSGAVDEYMNGQQRVLREHPAVKTYNSMIKNYSSVLKQLLDLLPEAKDKTEAVDELMAFVKQAKR